MGKLFFHKIIPVLLTILTFFLLATILYGVLLFLSSLNLSYPTILDFRRRELLFGIAIYLKTAIDFAIFTENLMRTNPGWKKKIAISLGTSLGNGFGTFFTVFLWTLLKEIQILSLIFVFVSSVIVLRLAQESFEEFLKQKKSFIKMRMPVSLLQDQLNFFNKISRPILRFLVTDLNLSKTKRLSFINLLTFSITIPFILGFNNFSGYIPVFLYINVFGFTLGIMLGHALLTIGLFTIPKLTVSIVKHPIVLIGGGLAFIGIGIFGFWQTIRIFTSLL